MLPNPLHPAVVHFPIVLVILLPLVALGALLAIRRGASFRPVWAVPLAVAAGLLASSWLAVETGDADEDRVESVVAESAIEKHEEAAERFLVLSGVLLLVVAAGLAPGSLGSAGRIISTIGAMGLVIAGAQVGASGGELVYEHGAAAAYTQPAAGGAAESGRVANGAEDQDEDRD